MIKTSRTFSSLLVLAAFVGLTGCQGSLSKKPPVHLNQNMDFQERFDAQESNAFFADNRAMREPVGGTVARGFLKDDTVLWAGRDANGDFVDNPLAVDMALLERGREKYDIYCSVCHGLSGDGLGIIMTGGYGYVPAPTYHSDMLRAQADGYIYDALTNGIRSMPGYGTQIRVNDRWAIVAYIRALQRSQAASAADVPESER
ncbi:MAG: cytochrome c [Bacteroidetes bacterium]|nr:cytochrome c [Bacteroidota bacterium]MDA0873824.1 cytochrome c [Bacteroidota bacterium]